MTNLQLALPRRGWPCSSFLLVFKIKLWWTKSRWTDQPNSNEKYTPFVHCVWSFESTSYNDLWDAVTRSFISRCYVRFSIRRYYFSLIFSASYNIIWKKDFRHEFSFFSGFTQLSPTPHYPRNMQSPLSVTKVFSQCFLMLKKKFTLWHEMIEFNEFSWIKFYSLAIGSKN